MFARAQQRELLGTFLDELPEIYRRAALHYLDGGSHQELAAREGIREETARQRLWKARHLLKRLRAERRLTRTPYRSTPSP